MSEKNQLLDQLWQKDQNIINTSNKLQALKISQSVFRTIQENTLVKIYDSGIYPNQFENQLKTIIPTWLYSQVKTYVQREANVVEKTEDFLFVLHECLLPMRNSRDEKIRVKKDFLQKRRYNQLSQSKKDVMLVYQDEETPCSKVARYFKKALDNSFLEHKESYKQ